MTPPIIECTGVSKQFVQRTIPVSRLQDQLLRLGDRGAIMRIDALRDVNLKIKHGEWVGLYGPNGSGKTTLLKIIAGLMAPDEGSVVCRGRLSSFFELGIGFHPDQPALENIRIHGLLHGLSEADIARMTDEALEFADIGEFATLPLKCYSTGMRMRLAFAASAFIDADIYLFDEIMAVGDEAFQKKCYEHLLRLKAAEKTVLIVSHNFSELCAFSHRILFFEKGRLTGQRKKIRFSDSPERELCQHPRMRQTNLVSSV